MIRTWHIACLSILALPAGAGALYSNIANACTTDQPVVVTLNAPPPTPWQQPTGPMAIAIPFTTPLHLFQRVTRLRFGVATSTKNFTGLVYLAVVQDVNDSPTGALVAMYSQNISGSWDGLFVADFGENTPILAPGAKYWLMIRNHTELPPGNAAAAVDLQLKANTQGATGTYRLLNEPGGAWYSHTGSLPAVELTGKIVFALM